MKPASQTLSTIVIVLASLLSTQTAYAQQACALRDAATVKLEKQFDEQVAGRGLARNGKAMFELFVSESGSWTVLVSDPKGRSCIIANGESWQQIPLVVGDPA